MSEAVAAKVVRLEGARAHKIIEHHELGLKYINLGVHHFAEAGRMLTEQKATMNHGEWGLWVQSNLPFGYRTARNYMQIWKNKAKWQRVANLKDEPLSLRQCLKIIGRPKEDEDEKAHRRNPAWLKRFYGTYAVGVSERSEQVTYKVDRYVFVEKANRRGSDRVIFRYTNKHRRHEGVVCFSCRVPTESIPEDRIVRIRDVLHVFCNVGLVCRECRRHLMP